MLSDLILTPLHGLIDPEVLEAEVTNGRKGRNLMASTAHAHGCKCFICSWIQDLTLHRQSSAF